MGPPPEWGEPEGGLSFMMDSNKDIDLAWEFVEHTGKSLFLTGKAGTGKTTFLKRVATESTKRKIVVAPTGVAAINAEGQTIHSFFQIPPGPVFVPGSQVQQKYNFSKIKRRILATLDLLIIDEVSMVRCDLLDAVDSVLRRYRHSLEPFGGVQLLLIGDLQQLTPVVTPQEEPLLSRFYDTPYFFGSTALKQVDYVTIELKQVYRQQQGAFLEVLNHIRTGQPSAQDLQLLNSRCNPDFRPDAREGYIRLTTHNYLADRYNERELEQLPGAATTLEAQVEGTFPESSFPTDQTLQLKVGAQVMFVKNDPTGKHRYYNGLIGRVSQLEENTLRVATPDGREIDVEPLTWENLTYSMNEETKEIEQKIVGTFRQIPLRLAWAITIHKSQGLTFDKAIIEADAAFASGQVYVALSRCRTLEGLVLAAPLPTRAVFSDPRVANYIGQQQAGAATSIDRLHDIENEYYRQQLNELFSFDALLRTEKYFLRQLEEFFSRFNKELLADHRRAVKHLETDVEEVARKWRLSMAAMSNETLHGEPFLERTQQGCTYFYRKLFPLTPLLQKSLKINSKNRTALNRLQNAFEDLLMAYLTKINLLFVMRFCSFSLPVYLKNKQMATLQAMEGNVPEEGDAPQPEEKKAKPKTNRPRPARKGPSNGDRP